MAMRSELAHHGGVSATGDNVFRQPGPSPRAMADEEAAASGGDASCWLKRALKAEAHLSKMQTLCRALYTLSGRDVDEAEGWGTEFSSRVQHIAREREEPPNKRRCVGGTIHCRRAGATAMVECASLLYTQASCSSYFSDGRSLETVLDLLKQGKAHPLREPWLRLDVIVYEGQMFSVDNRRLYCLHKYQEHLGAQRTVWARVNLYHWVPVFDRFWAHFDTGNGGSSIRVRQPCTHSW